MSIHIADSVPAMTLRKSATVGAGVEARSNRRTARELDARSPAMQSLPDIGAH